MEDNSKKNTSPLERFKRLVSKTNKLFLELEGKPEDKELFDKSRKYLNKLKTTLESLTNSPVEEVIEILYHCYDLEEKFLVKHGDELIEKLWHLYDYSDFHFNKFDFSNENYLVNFTDLFFLFDEHFSSFPKDIFEDNNEKKTRKLKPIFTRKYIAEDAEAFLPAFKNLKVKKNMLIDFLIYKIFSTIELKPFYVALAAFIINTERSVILLYKVLALFALAISQIEKKEDFVDGLFFISGGVLRAHARSYLKTKGVLDETLSFFSGCKKHKQHDEEGYFKPKILTVIECDYLESYFFPIMTEFLRCICYGLNFNIKWDDYLWLMFKNIELEELDNEDHIPPQVEISHFLMLFVFDFAFTFISNFTTITPDFNFQTKFEGFHEFFNYSVSIISNVNHNIFNVFKVSDVKKKIIEADCEKTEYRVKDYFNHYGLSLVLYLAFKGDLQLLDLKTKRALNAFPIPLSVSRQLVVETQESILYTILKFETANEINLFKEYRTICIDILNMIIKNRYSSPLTSISFYSNKRSILGDIFSELIFSEAGFKENRGRIQELVLLIDANSLVGLLQTQEKNEKIKKIIAYLNNINYTWKGLDSSRFCQLLAKYSFNSTTLDNEIFEFLVKLSRTIQNNSEYSKELNSLLSEIVDQERFITRQTHDSKENAEKEIESFKANHSELVARLKNLSK